MSMLRVVVASLILINGEEFDAHIDEDRSVMFLKSGLDPETYVRIGAATARADQIPLINLGDESQPLS